MEIEFDHAKSERNIRERGLSFELGGAVLINAVATLEDTRRDYGERRMIVFGRVDGRLLCMIHTWRGNALRVISLRGANRREKRRWLGIG